MDRSKRFIRFQTNPSSANHHKLPPRALDLEQRIIDNNFTDLILRFFIESIKGSEDSDKILVKIAIPKAHLGLGCACHLLLLEFHRFLSSRKIRHIRNVRHVDLWAHAMKIVQRVQGGQLGGCSSSQRDRPCGWWRRIRIRKRDQGLRQIGFLRSIRVPVENKGVEGGNKFWILFVMKRTVWNIIAKRLKRAYEMDSEAKIHQFVKFDYRAIRLCAK